MSATFEPGSGLHLAAVLGAALVVVGLLSLGRRLRGGVGERRLRGAWVAGIVLVQLAGLLKLPLGRFELAYDLPLHYCDVAVLAGAAALATGRRTWRALAWFWGLGLSTQACATPLLREGPARVEFWLFWLAHAQVVGTPLYDACVLRYRPGRRDLAVACAGVLVLAAVLVPLDLATGWNYGFVGRAPAPGTLVDVLPAWPWRLGALYLLACAAMAALWLVGALLSAACRGRGFGPRAPGAPPAAGA